MNNSLHQVTLRGIDSQLKKLLTQRAQKQQKSVNSYVVDVLKQNVGYKNSRDQSWQKFAGSIPEGGINQETLDDFETIDKDMW